MARWALFGSAIALAGTIWGLTRSSPELRRPGRSAIQTTPRSEARPLRAPTALEHLDDQAREAAPPATTRYELPAIADEIAEGRDAGVETTGASAIRAGEPPEPASDTPGAVGAGVAPAARAEPVPSDISEEEPAAPAPAPRRRVELAAFQIWQQPGMCGERQAASEAHRSLMRLFRAIGSEDGVRFYVDPRLPAGAHLPLLTHLAEAERRARADLGLTTSSAEVFAYHDRELLLAAACTNDDVVAYYDGALHVVVTRDDVQQSVIHEHAHHALMTHGVVGPTWAQEGIAMHVARENWWLSEHWLGQIADRPFSMDSMERAIPYTLTSEQAVLFYVQAAAMVACAARDQPDGLAGLVAALRASHSESEVSYELAVPGTPPELRVCIRALLEAAGGARDGRLH